MNVNDIYITLYLSTQIKKKQKENISKYLLILTTLLFVTIRKTGFIYFFINNLCKNNQVTKTC